MDFQRRRPGVRNTSTNLFAFDWVQTKSPAGATQWIPANGQAFEHRAGRARPVKAACANHVHDRPRAEVRPDYQKIAKRFRRTRRNSTSRLPRRGSS